MVPIHYFTVLCKIVNLLINIASDKIVYNSDSHSVTTYCYQTSFNI